MSKAPRPATWKTRSRTWAGHCSWFGQRRSLSPSFCSASSVPQAGQWVGITHGSSPSGRSASTGPRISGITSPALRRITVSPGRTSLRRTSWALCRVAFSTVEPATRVGTMTPYGVTRPVRPTLTRMSSSSALTSSGGYLNAIAQRGARLVEPRRRWRLTSSTLTTTPSISCSTSWRCSPWWATSASTSASVASTVARVAGRQAPGAAGRRTPRTARAGLEAAPGADAVADHAQRAGRGDPGVLLAQRAGGGVAGVGEDRLAGLGHRLVEPLERGHRQEHLAAHLDELGHRELVGAGEPVRDRVDRLDVGRDVLAGAAVAAGQRPHQPARPRRAG